MRMINRSHRYDINRTRPRRDYEYKKSKICLSVMMVMCNIQHLSNIWSWIHEKNKQHWDWVEKCIVYKNTCISVYMITTLHYLHCATYFDKLKWEAVSQI